MCWGAVPPDAAGQTTTATSPVLVAGLSGVRELANGGSHRCALTIAGGVMCWGANDSGQLGIGTTDYSATPVTPLGLKTGVLHVSAGLGHSCVVKINGTVLCWGDGDSGQIGDGARTDRLVPTAMPSLGPSWTVEAGGNFSCAVLLDRTVKCWGDSLYGQVGSGDTLNHPSPMPALGLANVNRLALGWATACAITTDTRIWCWGRNSSGQAGTGTTGTYQVSMLVPNLVPEITGGVSAVDVGWGHACAIVNGSMLCWGANESGQQGQGTVSNTWTTEPIAVPGMTNVTSIAVGDSHTCAITGSLYCWGNNNRGQIGDATTQRRASPTPVVGFSG